VVCVWWKGLILGSEEHLRGTLVNLQVELEQARTDAAYYQKEAQMAKLGERRPGQEVIQLKKTILALQRQVASLEALLAHCTCDLHSSHSIT
jgi:hypothetical protein